MTRTIHACAFGCDVRVAVDEIPAVDVVDVPVAVIVDAGLAVRFGFVGPELVTQLDVIGQRAVVEQRDGHAILGCARAPCQGACDIIQPPLLPLR